MATKEATLWEIVREGKPVVTADHWLELRDPDGHWVAHARWDGCVEITRFLNGADDMHPSDEDSDSIHLCDLDEAIARLVEIRRLAREHFGDAEAWSVTPA